MHCSSGERQVCHLGPVAANVRRYVMAPNIPSQKVYTDHFREPLGGPEGHLFLHSVVDLKMMVIRASFSHSFLLANHYLQTKMGFNEDLRSLWFRIKPLSLWASLSLSLPVQRKVFYKNFLTPKFSQGDASIKLSQFLASTNLSFPNSP